MGWLTTEELVWNEKGRLTTHAPSTYKIPTANDPPRAHGHPPVDRGRAHVPTIHRSKAVGEPPFMLAISVLSALTQAVMAATPDKDLRSCTPPLRPSAFWPRSGAMGNAIPLIATRAASGWAGVARALLDTGPVALVTILATEGSTPLGAGARMVVVADGLAAGSVGGGALEATTLAQARAMLSYPAGTWRVQDYPLGPLLGQCCGRRVRVLVERLDPRHCGWPMWRPVFRWRPIWKRAP
jgi:hypothetical protein